jgi:DNA-binding response OmpR family regulator
MPRRVLIADDEPNIVISLEFLMQQSGYEVRVARNGDEALAEVQAFAPDLVLLDVMMPQRSGYEVLQAIRGDPARRATKVLLLTAKGRDVDVEKGLGLGADGYLTKPFATRDLVGRVKALLGDA